MGNIRRTFQLITAIPFATLGAIAGIAKVIVYSVALIMEVMVTIFLYKFVQEFLLSIPSIVEVPFSRVLYEGDAGSRTAFMMFLANGGFITMMVTLVSVIVVIFFTVMAMRLRKTLVKAVEEAATKLVEKFTDTSVTPPGSGGLLQSMAGSGAAGAGSALSSRMMGGGSNAKSGAAPNAGGTNGGPEGISTSASNSTDVGGDVDTDGTLQGPGELKAGEDEAKLLPAGNDGGEAITDGSGGSDLDPGGQGEDADQVRQIGRGVEAEGGLSNEPGSSNQDAMDVAAGSVEDSQEHYSKADKSRLGAGKDAAEGVGRAGLAVARGAAGDGQGAVKEGAKAAESAGKAVEKNADANEQSEQAGKSSLDNPEPSAKHARQKQIGQGLKNAGGTVSDAADQTGAGGTGGGGGGGTPT